MPKEGEAPPPTPTVPHARRGEKPARGGDSVGQSSATRIKCERIAHIETLMATNKWRSGVTAYELSDRWGVGIKAIEAYAAEASRRIKNEFNPEERRQLKALWLRNVYEAQRECRESGDMSALGKMLDLEARALGHFEAEKVQVSGNLGDLLQLGLAEGSEEPSPTVD